MRVLGIITARGGSKGIPRKNIVPLAGKPLLAWTAEAALASKLTRIVLSSEDLEIAEVAKRYGIEVPFLRPAELAQDETPTLPVLQDTVRRLAEADDHYDAVCLLQPTNPLRGPALIDQCIDLMESADVDSVFTVLPVPAKFNPHWVFRESSAGNLELMLGEERIISRRQDLPQTWHREGSVYVTRIKVLLEQNSLYGQTMRGLRVDPAQSVNIDEPADLLRAEELLRERFAERENTES